MILTQYPIEQNQITGNFCKSQFIQGYSQDTSFSNHSQQTSIRELQNQKAQNLQEKIPDKCKKKYKTELCKNFMITGECRYGKLCCYAHGKHDLRQKIIEGDNYKKKQGFCSYGGRCQYYHFDSPTKFQILLKNLSEKTEIKFAKNRNFSMRKFLQKQTKINQRLPIFLNKFKMKTDSAKRGK